ncbi:MAG: hypothetical protein RXR02_10690 [Thermoproteus sp.]
MPFMTRWLAGISRVDVPSPVTTIVPPLLSVSRASLRSGLGYNRLEEFWWPLSKIG